MSDVARHCVYCSDPVESDTDVCNACAAEEWPEDEILNIISQGVPYER